MVQGREAIIAMWKSTAEQVGDPKLTTVDVKPLGTSAAREIGTFSLKTKGQAPQEVSGKYVVVWEKIGTDWKLATDIWNEGK
jgi:ketosteroid isomerase-like protein